MKRISWLVMGALLLASGSGLAESLVDLSMDAEQFQRELLQSRVEGAPEQVTALLESAQIMRKQKQCGIALKLRLQGIRMGGQTDAAAWRGVAKDAACAKRWEEASRAGWLALQFDQPLKQQLQGWADLGNALESRSNWKTDWKPGALEAFNQVLKEAQVGWVQKRVEKLQQVLNDEARLQVEQSRIDTDGAQPGLCIEFNDKMPKADQLNYGDYFRFEPAFNAAFKVGWGDVCAYGAAWGTAYRVRLLKGLSGAKRALGKHQEVTLDSGTRPAALWFERSAYVLAAGARPEVPLHVINTPATHLQLLRIHERNILSPWVQERFQDRLRGNELERIATGLGETVWSGEIDTSGAANRDHLAWLSLPRSAIEKPGLYVLAAREPGESVDWRDRATQWLVVTDVGLTSYRGMEGLTLVARRLGDAQPVAGATLSLIARNNEPLGVVTTDVDGVARFSAGLLQGEGGKRAAQVTATGSGLGFTFLALEKPAFDLSDRGVEGRLPPGPLDAYPYTERGVYRPGEQVNLAVLLRDYQGAAVNGLPLTLKLQNPAGDPVVERVLQGDDAGAYLTTLQLGEGARTGMWRAALHADPKAPPVGSTTFLVEQVVPPRMEAAMVAEGVLQPGTPGRAEVSARYLFGAPGARRPVRAEFFVEADGDPFPAHAGFRFGMDGERVESRRIEMPSGETDDQGVATLQPLLSQPPAARQPLRARLRAEVMDVDGRVVAAEAHLPIRHLPLYLGIAPPFSGAQAEANGEHTFRVIALDAEGQPVAREGVEWRLIAEEWDYQWFRKGGSWAYERVLHERPAGSGVLGLEAAGPTELVAQVGRGEYRLEVQDDQAAVAAIYRFRAGDQVLASHDTPDAVKLTLDQPDYLAGDRARLTLEAPFSGSASLVIAGEKIHTMETLSLEGTTGEVEIPVAHNWGAGAYALVTVYRPGEGSERGAGRAIGVAWIGVRPQQQTLELSLERPEVVRSGDGVEVGVRVVGAAPGEQVRLTLAAVDDGVLNLTDFVPPDPIGHFFGKRRLGVGILDLYGRLIPQRDQRPEALREGGGTSGRRGMPPSNVEIVSLFSGAVAVDDEGLARIPLTLPDYNGRLRLMVVAWSRHKMGSVSGTLQVRDPVVVMAAHPRFMALRDRAELSVLLNNMEGPAGEYRLGVTGEGAVAVGGPPLHRFSLAPGDERTERFALAAEGLGEGWVALELDGPEGYHYQKRVKIGVRGRFLPTVERRYQKLPPGETLQLDDKLVSGLFAERAQVVLSISPRPALDIPGLLDELRHYPFGCLEQLVSRALPLLHANQLAERWGGEVDPNRQHQLNQLIQRMLDKQLGSGAFGLWSERDEAERWLTAYAMELLTLARREGYEVSNYFYERGLAWLTELVSNTYAEDPEQLAAKSYAHYVLALAGEERPEEARYLLEHHLADLPTSLAAAQMGAAMALLGEQERARGAFAHALRGAGKRSIYHDYGSGIRDKAAVIALLEESGGDLGDTASAWNDLVLEVQKRRWLSTQERAWLIRAANALPVADSVQLAVDAQPSRVIRGTWVTQLEGSELAAGRAVRNSGKVPVWVTLGIEGTPLERPTAPDLGFSLKREWYGLDGEAVDPIAVAQGDLMIALIQGQASSGQPHRALVMDLLPAGFEIENPRLADALDPRDFAWLPALSSTRHVEVLDDRFVAALDLPRAGKGRVAHFTLAYLLRAVTPGHYTVSPAEVEDMYRPRFRARTPVREIVVLESGSPVGTP